MKFALIVVTLLVLSTNVSAALVDTLPAMPWVISEWLRAILGGVFPNPSVLNDSIDFLRWFQDWINPFIVNA